jgi:hypothetical protein
MIHVNRPWKQSILTILYQFFFFKMNTYQCLKFLFGKVNTNHYFFMKEICQVCPNNRHDYITHKNTIELRSEFWFFFSAILNAILLKVL